MSSSSLSPPSRLSPAFASTRAARFFRGVPVSSASASRPGAAAVRLSRQARWRGVPSPARPVPGLPTPPGAGPGSSRSPRRCASLPRVCGGPAAAPHPLSSARPRPPAWNRGVVSRRGASRGSASVSRRLGGSRRVASPGPGHPSPSSRSSLPLVRPRPAVRCSLPAAVCVCRGFPSFPSGGRRPRFSSLSSPAWVFRPPCAPLARSLPRVSASLDGRQAGRAGSQPAGRAG